ncbi:MAG: hypothetical protein FWF53_09255 [Candidatus Azobacteroides sp.]|nr:hypothetical protein [Candidatus Azobacteroides sp.]
METIQINSIDGKVSIKIIESGEVFTFPPSFRAVEQSDNSLLIKSPDINRVIFVTDLSKLTVNGEIFTSADGAVEAINELNANFKSPGGTGGTNPGNPVWGTITGNLDNQTDLKARLQSIEDGITGTRTAIVFDTEEQMREWLAGTYTRPDGIEISDLKIGEDIYIINPDDPDFWWTGDDVKELTEKTDLSGYYNKTEIDELLAEKLDSDTNHNDLLNRDTTDCHPVSAITDAVEEAPLAGIKPTNIESGAYRIVIGQDGKTYFLGTGVYFLDNDGLIKPTNITSGTFRAGAIAQNGKLYFGANSGVWYLDNDGLIKQTNRTSGSFPSAAMGQNGKLHFIGSANIGIYYLDNDGLVKPTNAGVGSGNGNGAMMGQDGKLYFYGVSYYYQGTDIYFGIKRLNEDGQIVTVKADGLFLNSAIGPGGKLYFCGNGGGLWYLDDDGSIKQAAHYPSGINTAKVFNGKFYIGTEVNGIMYLEDGELKPTNITNGSCSSMEVGQDGILYFTSYSGIWYLDDDGLIKPTNITSGTFTRTGFASNGKLYFSGTSGIRYLDNPVLFRQNKEWKELSHNLLPGRNKENCHPIESITGLREKLNELDDIDLSGYYDKQQTDALLDEKIGKGADDDFAGVVMNGQLISPVIELQKNDVFFDGLFLLSHGNNQIGNSLITTAPKTGDRWEVISSHSESAILQMHSIAIFNYEDAQIITADLTNGGAESTLVFGTVSFNKIDNTISIYIDDQYFAMYLIKIERAYLDTSQTFVQKKSWNADELPEGDDMILLGLKDGEFKTKNLSDIIPEETDLSGYYNKQAVDELLEEKVDEPVFERIRQTNITTDNFYCAALGQDNRLYFGSNGNTGVCYLDNDGLIKQTNMTTGNFNCAVLGQDDRLYFGSGSNTGVWYLDDDGLIKQTNKTDGYFYSAALGQDNKLYFGGPGIWYLDNDGLIKQTNMTTGNFPCAKLGQDNKLYFGGIGNFGIYYLDNDGLIKYTNKINGTFNCSSLGQDGKLYFGGSGIWYLDNDGLIKQTNKTDGTFNYASLGQDNKLYFCSLNTGVWRLEDDGTVVQTNKTDGTFRSASLGQDNKLYFGGPGIWYLDNDGLIKQTNKTDGTFRSAVLGQDGKLYFGGSGIWYLDLAVLFRQNKEWNELNHNLIPGRKKNDCHPIESISGLRDELDGKASVDIYSDIDLLETRIENMENLGNFAGSFAAFAQVPTSATAIPGITINDFITVRADETNGGATTRYIASDITAGVITWTYDVTYSTDISGKADDVPSGTTKPKSRTSSGWADTEATDITFTEALARTNIESGETLITLFGKIKKYFTDFPGLLNGKLDKGAEDEIAKVAVNNQLTDPHGLQVKRMIFKSNSGALLTSGAGDGNGMAGLTLDLMLNDPADASKGLKRKFYASVENRSTGLFHTECLDKLSGALNNWVYIDASDNSNTVRIAYYSNIPRKVGQIGIPANTYYLHEIYWIDESQEFIQKKSWDDADTLLPNEDMEVLGLSAGEFKTERLKSAIEACVADNIHAVMTPDYVQQVRFGYYDEDPTPFTYAVQNDGFIKYEFVVDYGYTGQYFLTVNNITVHCGRGMTELSDALVEVGLFPVKKGDVIHLTVSNPGVFQEWYLFFIPTVAIVPPLKMPAPDYSRETELGNIASVPVSSGSPVAYTVQGSGFIIFDVYKASSWTAGGQFYINGALVFTVYIAAAGTLVSAPLPVKAGDTVSIISAGAAQAVSRCRTLFYPVIWI